MGRVLFVPVGDGVVVACCVLVLLVYLVLGCVYLIMSDQKLKGLSFRRKVREFVACMKAYPGHLLADAKYRLLGLWFIVVAHVVYTPFWGASSASSLSCISR